MGAKGTRKVAAASNTGGLIDTDILVDATRGLAAAIKFLTSQQAATGVRISIVSAMELVAGCRSTTELAQVQQFLHRVIVLPVSNAASQAAYHLMESFFLSHGSTILGFLRTDPGEKLRHALDAEPETK